MGNLTPMEEAVLESLTTDEERKAKEIERIVQWMKIKFSKSKIKTGKINPCKPFDCTISLEPPFGFGDGLGLWYDVIDILASYKRVHISDIKRKITVKFYGVKERHNDYPLENYKIFTKMKYRITIIDLDEKIGRHTYENIHRIVGY